MKLTIGRSDESLRSLFIGEMMKRRSVTARSLAFRFKCDPIRAMRIIIDIRRSGDVQMQSEYRQIGDGRGTIHQESVYTVEETNNEHILHRRAPIKGGDEPMRLPRRKDGSGNSANSKLSIKRKRN